MSIVFALTVAALAMEEQPTEMEARGRAVAEAILAAKPPTVLPYTTPRMRYRASVPKGIRYRVPRIQNSLVAFHNALRGCTIDRVEFHGASGIAPDIHPTVGILVDCPNDFAHAKNGFALILEVVDGKFAEVELQVGMVSSPFAPTAPPGMTYPQ